MSRIVQATSDAIAEAAEALNRGELVGMPTETVYGIAARIDRPTAIDRIFELKGRPSENPLIVHLSHASQVEGVAIVDRRIDAVATRFWPGPLTLVLPRRPSVSDRVTGGLDTVAVRVPGHPIARALIERCGCPLAAPSANRFTMLSPTRAEDVSREIASGLALILDGGPCNIGLESTVLDLAGPARVLRPGAVTAEELADALGTPLSEGSGPEPHRSPGQYERHYSPRTRLVIVDSLGSGEPGITFRPTKDPTQRTLPHDPAEAMRMLYRLLHELDRQGHPQIGIERPPEDAAWAAVWDRLLKAAGD